MVSRRSFKFRAYPNKEQERRLDETIETCRRLYNSALAERKDAWETEARNVSYLDQANALSSNKNEWQARVHSQVLQDVLRRLRKAFDAFFRRVKDGEEPGYPRFKGRDRYDSFSYPQSGFSVEGSRLTLSKIGSVRIKFHRPIEGAIKTCTILRDADQWYAVFSCDIERTKVANNGPSVGIDVGLKTFATLTDGTTVENPRFLKASAQKIGNLQRILDGKKKGSNRRRKAKMSLSKAHRKVRNQRRDFNHKLSLRLAKSYSTITNIASADAPGFIHGEEAEE